MPFFFSSLDIHLAPNQTESMSYGLSRWHNARDFDQRYVLAGPTASHRLPQMTQSKRIPSTTLIGNKINKLWFGFSMWSTARCPSRGLEENVRTETWGLSQKDFRWVALIWRTQEGRCCMPARVHYWGGSKCLLVKISHSSCTYQEFYSLKETGKLHPDNLRSLPIIHVFGGHVMLPKKQAATWDTTLMILTYF